MGGANQNKDTWAHRRRRLAASFAFLCVVVLCMGLTYTWFVGNQSASTVAKVAKPSKLQILGPNSTSIEQLDLSYDASNIDSEKKVTVRRGFCVESGGEGFELQVANTTNISGIEIKVYRVTVGGTKKDLVVDSSTTWDKNGEAIGFTVINDSNSDGIANTPTGNNDETFGNFTSVQANAAPLYRYHSFSTGDLDMNGDTAADVTNFIIEISWTESMKETDMVYLIAKNTSTSTNS